MFNIEELIKKWQELGFLEQMPENLKPVLALKYELVANYVVSHDSYMGSTTLSNVIFSIVYRIYKKGKTIPNVESFIRQAHEFFFNDRDLSGWSDTDVEAEMCALFVEHWEPQKGLEPLKWVSKHKFPKKGDAPFLKKIRVRTIPANFILDDKGVVIAKNIHGRALLDLVKNYMKKK